MLPLTTPGWLAWFGSFCQGFWVMLGKCLHNFDNIYGSICFIPTSGWSSSRHICLHTLVYASWPGNHRGYLLVWPTFIVFEFCSRNVAVSPQEGKAGLGEIEIFIFSYWIALPIKFCWLYWISFIIYVCQAKCPVEKFASSSKCGLIKLMLLKHPVADTFNPLLILCFHILN